MKKGMSNYYVLLLRGHIQKINRQQMFLLHLLVTIGRYGERGRPLWNISNYCQMANVLYSPACTVLHCTTTELHCTAMYCTVVQITAIHNTPVWRRDGQRPGLPLIPHLPCFICWLVILYYTTLLIKWS